MKASQRAIGAAAVLAVAALTGCGHQASGTEALADEVVAVSGEFSRILEESAHLETSELDDRLFTPLGRDYRELGPKVQMSAGFATLLSSAINERDATVVMVLATDEHTPHGLNGEHSNAFTCVEFAGIFQEDPNVERRNADCSEQVMESYLGIRHYSVDELNYRSQDG